MITVLIINLVIINKVTLALGLGKLGYSAPRLLAIRDPNFWLRASYLNMGDPVVFPSEV